MKTLVFLAVSLFAAGNANICSDDTGHWLASLAMGVEDYAYGGSKLNNRYYCFEGCLNTGTALQNYKVLLAGNGTTMSREINVKERGAQLAKRRDDDDPNAETCIDPVLRQDVADALKKNTQWHCKGIVNTLVLNLNRPGWAITCIKFDEFGFDEFVQDVNFCSYDAFNAPDTYTIRLAKLDTA
ncbi:unnamed protein product [Caenorhabditis bovis]|uniref:Uncharacterized protein n=1 Tax=Caenorhabditis bovis TaxID=2654633 RepID=A0A8S1EV83_9PELO|nr:unnamed protein product [Caenorhabditis bovis]